MPVAAGPHTERVRQLASASPDPGAVLRHLDRLRIAQPAAYERIIASPAVLQMAVAVASHSDFLAAEVERAPEWIEALPTRGDLHRVVSAEEYVDLLEASLGPETLATELARFRRRQLLRIVVRDVQGFGTLGEITEEISNLADAILEFALTRLRANLAEQYGAPGKATFAVLSLGKLGGSELNYSSDIDLMFVYSENGQSGGVSHKEFFSKLASRLTEVLSAPGPHGVCYRVDLRLRPEGTNGEICLPLAAAKAYYAERARDWELQMFIKARVSAGDRALGRALLDFVEPLTYATSTDFGAIEAVSEARVRISEKVTRRRAAARPKPDSGIDVKLAPGGIRDIEFLVQCLQRLHGGREPWVRHGGTQLALFRLHDKGLLSSMEFSRLALAYEFLRQLEHRLQMVADRQTHTLPTDAAGQERIALRMPGGPGTAMLPEALAPLLKAHLASVREIYDRVIHAQTWQAAPPAAGEPAAEEPAPSNLVRSLELTAPGLAGTLATAGLERGRVSFERFLEQVLPNPKWLGWLDSDPTLVANAADIFEHSPYFAEQLNRKPELIEVLRDLDAPPEPLEAPDSATLRRHYIRNMLRIQARSICRRTPIFDTLAATSALAGDVIAAAYRVAVDETRAAHPPSAPGYAPANQMMLIALGRLGMLEFDLGSDADLLFVLPDEDSAELVFWTRVANRMIDILMAYTGEGVIFTVDTRLRPSGREGNLVRTESAYKDYFAHTAAAWEGITYMKSRAVAGDEDRGTRFLHDIQAVDWERYGQDQRDYAGRSRHELRRMRRRLEEEQGHGNPLKASAGGYYDIDFILMYLRLKGAGVFFRVLNTPARIDALRRMGQLTQEDAAFLGDAATFYRALDHALRLSSGHAEGKLPSAPLQLAILTNLVRRWTAPHLHDQPLPVELAQIQAKTRALFNKFFGAE